MIPKVIHYCWFGGQKKPEYAKTCISSWKTFLPDFQIMEWNEQNFALDHPFVANAIKCNLWAFVSDYVRVNVLHKHGGVYLDTDMLFFRPLPEGLLLHEAFIGSEDNRHVSAGIIGSTTKGKFMSDVCSFYNRLGFVREYQKYIIPKVLTERIVKHEGDFTAVTYLSDVVVYPSEYFYALPFQNKKEHWSRFISNSSICVHLWAGTWLEQIEERKCHKFVKAKEKSISEIEVVIPVGADFILVDEGRWEVVNEIAGRKCWRHSLK
jgi:hypothetical protein